MEWSQKRKVLYMLIFVCAGVLLAAYPTYRILNPSPTCFDQKHNGGEVGADCGGPCARYCASEIKPLRVVWARAFFFAPEHYDVGAYIENPNPDAGLLSARYTVRIFDATGQQIAERSSSVEIAPRAATFLFEGNFTLKVPPEKVEVEFNDEYLSRMTKAHRGTSTLSTKNQNLKQTDTTQRFDAVLVNSDPLNGVSRISLGAIIFDAARNPLAISRTFVDKIDKGSEQKIFFTWPNPFSGTKEGDRLITDIVIMTPSVFEN